jgi:uncharacterized membrane protein YfcA
VSATAAVLFGLFGLCVGAFGTIVGAGGGFILTPLLLIIYPHDSAATITSISLVAVFANAGSGSLAYARQRRIDYRSATVFALAALPGAVLGALAVGLIPRRAFDALTALVLFAMALWLVLDPPGRQRTPRGRLTHRHFVDRAGHTFDYDVALRRGVIYSAGVGFLSSLLGIGGGIMHVPLLVRTLGFPTHLATAASHFVLAITSGTASVTHILNGSFAHARDVVLAVILGVSMAAGAQVGARASAHMSGALIERLLVLSLVVLGLRLALASAGLM